MLTKRYSLVKKTQDKQGKNPVKYVEWRGITICEIKTKQLPANNLSFLECSGNASKPKQKDNHWRTFNVGLF